MNVSTNTKKEKKNMNTNDAASPDKHIDERYVFFYNL